MLRFYVLGQLGLATLVVVLVAERARELFHRAPTSEHALRWLRNRLQKGDTQGPLLWARARQGAYVSQVLQAALDPAGSEGEGEALSDLVQLDLRYAAGRRLGVLRVAATMASVLGLLGGILAIRQGFDDDSLLALQAGLAQKVALAHALESMALGVGTSAFCFFALGLFRRVARDVLRQATHIAHILSQQQLATGVRAKGPSQ